MGRSIVALGDWHAPFHHREATIQAIDAIEVIQPAMVIQMGDLYDLFSFSKYPRGQSVIKPEEEIEQARKHALWLWERIRKASPRSKLVQLTGNHDERPLKRCLERLPEMETFVIRGMRDMFEFPGVETIHDASEEYEHDGILFMHGYLKFGAHAQKNRMPTVTGHLHRCALVMFPECNAWELNVGWLGDRKQPVFSYHPQKRMHGTTLGFGLIDALGPRFVPL